MLGVAYFKSVVACDLKVDWNMFDEMSNRKVMEILLQSSESNMTCVVLLQELRRETDDKTALASNIRVFGKDLFECLFGLKDLRGLQADDGSCMEEPGSGYTFSKKAILGSSCKLPVRLELVSVMMSQHPKSSSLILEAMNSFIYNCSPYERRTFEPNLALVT
ncbi:hypothetical protein Tco_0090145 [Tanacetum coccineum]